MQIFRLNSPAGVTNTAPLRLQLCIRPYKTGFDYKFKINALQKCLGEYKAKSGEQKGVVFNTVKLLCWRSSSTTTGVQQYMTDG